MVERYQIVKLEHHSRHRKPPTKGICDKKLVAISSVALKSITGHKKLFLFLAIQMAFSSRFNGLKLPIQAFATSTLLTGADGNLWY